MINYPPGLFDQVVLDGLHTLINKHELRGVHEGPQLAFRDAQGRLLFTVPAAGGAVTLNPNLKNPTLEA